MTYLEALHQAHRIEVSGEATYAAAGRFARSPERRAKWQVLAQLETQMKRRLADAITQLGGAAEERQLDLWGGYVVGALLAYVPWPIMLRVYRRIVVGTTHFWERLARDHPDGDPALLKELIAHEIAQVEFAERELAGREGSLEPTRVLLKG